MSDDIDFVSRLLEITAIAFQGQLSNMLGEKRAGVSVEKESEWRPVCKQLRQLIKRYPYKLSALARGSGSKPFTWVEKSEFAQRLAVSHRGNRRLFSLDDNVDGTHLNDDDGVGNLITFVNQLTRQENRLLSNSRQRGEIIGSYSAEQIGIPNKVGFIHETLSPSISVASNRIRRRFFKSR